MRRIWRYLVFILLGAALAAFLYRIRAVLAPFFLAAAFAYMIDPVVTFLERRGAPRAIGTAIVYIAIIISMSLACIYFFPRFLSQLEQMVIILPSHAARLQLGLAALYDRFDRFYIPMALRAAINDAINRGELYIRDLAKELVETLMGILSHFLGIIIVPVLAFYLTKDINRIRGRIAGFLLAKGRGDIIALVGQIDGILSSYVRGQLLVGAIVGILTTIALALMDVDFALIVGILAGILNVIPYFGPILGAIPAVCASLLKSPWTGLWAGIVFILIQQLESSLIAPKILGDRVGLHPLVVVFSLLVGAELLGFTGLLIAVPVTAVLNVLAGFIWERAIGNKIDNK
ncbi:MAG: AI-2E family transporter [Firmicutes bacterium]|nr:AI-2E family transporter [Bacillota bacterium]